MTETEVDAADFDGDGRIDLFLSAYLSDASAYEAGAAYLVYGPFGGTLDLGAADARWLGTYANDNFASDLAAIPDMDGDGDAELATSALFHDYGSTSTSTSASDRGAVWIWPGE